MSAKLISCIIGRPFDVSNDISTTPIKRTYIKLVFISLLITVVYLFLNLNTYTRPSAKTNITTIQSKLKAYIITADCHSSRFNVTKQNIELAFPNFFDILCYLTIPLNDSRIHTSSVLIWKKFSSNLLAFIELWTYKIPNESKNVYEWTFIFEDDVNFNKPQNVLLSDFIQPLKEFMNISEVQVKDGFFYLGICGPTYPNGSTIIISDNTNGTLYSKKGYGYCLHASAITAKRARLFWTEISSYRPNPTESSLDLHLRSYSIRSGNYFYIFGSNYLYPPGTGHFGIAFQDRGRFSTSIA